MQGDILKTFIDRLINSPVSNESIQGLADIFEEVVKVKKCLPNLDIPYEEITEYIYEISTDINLDDLDLMMEGLETHYVENFPNYKNGTKHKNHRCLSKFRKHIYLAAVQKDYIKKITQDAQEMASTARNISNLAKEAADKANKSSEKAELLAIKAEDLANDADAQAKSTIANYISILGIFASIIFTLFGGVNLIGSTVKLLEVNSRWPYLTFIIALLMICLLTLLNMMVKWVNSMSNLKRALENQNTSENAGVEEFSWCKPKTWDFYTKSVSGFLIIIIVSLGGMYSVNKENLFTLTTETTTKTPPKVEENTPQKPIGVEGNIPKADLKQESNGDTLTCYRFNFRRSETKLRFAYIDAPESTQSYGPESKRLIKKMVYRKVVRVRITDIDRYGRCVGEIYRFQRSMNEEMVKRGAAWVYEDYIKDKKHLKHMNALQSHAKKHKKGLWRGTRPIRPSDYRKMKK